MKRNNFFLNIIIFIELIIPSFLQYEYIYNIDDVINYINEEKIEKENFISIIDYLINIFIDAYAFYEISAEPPQPNIKEDYFSKVDILSDFKQLQEKIENNIIEDVYDFYRERMYIISKLKDCHIEINWKFLNLDDFFILAPIDFIIKEVNGKPKIFPNCIDEAFINCNDQEALDVLALCVEYTESPIKSINGYNPFDYINNFGDIFLSTKNEHALFSYRLKFHNNIPLSEYPLKNEEDFNRLEIIFEEGNEDKITTKYYIGSDADIYNEDRRYLRNLQNKKFLSKKEKTKKKKKFTKRRNLYDQVNWNNNFDDLIKCYEDSINKINIYYISTFGPENRDKEKFLKTIEKCYELFDKNIYPIVVINDLNDGGFLYLSQIFLGIISPLMSIDLFKGRIRITDAFKDTEEIAYFIETNLTSSESCLHTNYELLTSNKIHAKYNQGLEDDLTQIFFLNNITIHNYIENARKKMNNKRKPTDILVYTDGYTFSAASLFMQYLQKSGGGIIASYLGNPNHKNDIYFDISQSPSPIFTNQILKIFSPENYVNLNKDFENEWEIQMPGIQSFYNSKDYKIPLEYELILPDINSNIYETFDEETYDKFIQKSKEIFEKFKNECNPKNKNLIKVSEDCDNKFGNKYTHGGYECGDDGKWSNKCVPSYCDQGYFFNKNKMKCIKDICSSIPIQIEDEEKTNIMVNTTLENKNNGKKYNNYTGYFQTFLIIKIFLLFFLYY